MSIIYEYHICEYIVVFVYDYHIRVTHMCNGIWYMIIICVSHIGFI